MSDENQIDGGPVVEGTFTGQGGRGVQGPWNTTTKIMRRWEDGDTRWKIWTSEG